MASSFRRRSNYFRIRSNILQIAYVIRVVATAYLTSMRGHAIDRREQPQSQDRRSKMKVPTLVSAAAALTISQGASAEALPSNSTTITYHQVKVDGLNIFYREAGPEDAPTIVLLHGYPSSSRMFDTLIPLLATRYHLIAPDYPGFGESEAPPPSRYVYTFDHLAETTNALLEQLKIDHYVLYMQDYGGPVGFRIMVKHPERIRAIIVQNANAYKEGLGAKWTAIAEYWAEPKAHPEIFKAFSSLEGARQRHIAGSPQPERYNPDTWTDE